MTTASTTGLSADDAPHALGENVLIVVSVIVCWGGGKQFWSGAELSFQAEGAPTLSAPYE
jgi:hypothetical protein